MKIFFFCILIISYIIISSHKVLLSQVNQRWISTFNGPSNIADEPRKMVLDASGNIYITGIVRTPGFLSPSDFATIKYNSGGVQQWVAYYNGPVSADSSRDVANSIAVDNSGNVYVAGTSYEGEKKENYVTIKYNSNGVQQWAAKYNGPANNYDNASALAIDNFGNVYVTGTSVGSTLIHEYATIKYDSAGEEKWVRRYIGSGDMNASPNDIKVDATGNVYVTGSSNHLGTSNNYATVKYNSAGVQQWAVQYFGVSNFQDDAYALAVDDAGNVYVTGASWGNNLDYATIKYHPTGAQLWARRYNGAASSTDITNSISVDSLGNVYVTGFSLGSGTSYDYATVKYNSNGDTLWVRRYDYGPGGNRDDRAFSLSLDGNGNVYVTGWSSSSTFNDYATIKYNSTGSQLWVQRYNGVGNYEDDAVAVAADNSGNVYVTGKSWRDSSNFDYVTIKYSPSSVLQLTALIEGFYNESSDTMIPDTCKVYLRNVNSPYAIIDSSKEILNSNGTGALNFFNAVNGTPYFLVIKHRNSIETWSAGGNSFTSNSLSYNFTASSFQAFGNNMVLKGTKYCIYSADVNQDGIVDGVDMGMIENDSRNFVSGYVITDVNGDNTVDGSDGSIADNNSFNFVGVHRP